MPAALRGGTRTPARPRTKASAAPARSRPQPKKPAAYAPAKLRAAQGVGLSPQHALAAAGAILVVALAIALATGHRGERLVGDMKASVDGRFAALGFTVRAVHVQGADEMAKADILRAAGAPVGSPMLGLDLDAVRARVEAVGWVKEARVVRLLPDTLVLAVVQRRELAVWQHGGRSVIIDDQGRVIPEADYRRFPDLPLIVGAGAADHAAPILNAVAQRPRLKDRLEALVRVDGRRWDVRLKDGSLVQLPASDEENALIQLEQLDQRTRILDLGFSRIDLRNPGMVAVRPREGAPTDKLVADGV